MKIALYIAFHNKSSIDCCKEIIDIISQNNQLVIDSKIKNELNKETQNKFSFFDSKNPIEDNIDFVFAVGGDGTILRSITYVKDSNIPILGVNTGRLGFLTSIQKEDIQEAISQINENKFSVIKRTLLEVKSNSINNAFSDYPFALNEITIQRKDTTSLLNISCQINGNYLTNYWSDGLIISTPTGSTAYSLSCGGPIISPGSNNFVITPVSPHNLNLRPMVVADDVVIRLRAESRESHFLLTMDSRSVSIENNEEIFISKADFSIKLIELPDHNFFKTIRNKLFWGKDSRN